MDSEITCVIPSYRNHERVGQAIDSMLCQPGVKMRVIVVIDDQCRETQALAGSFGAHVETIWNETNRGAPYSRNAGLARTETPFVMFLDSDDWVEGDLVSGLCDAVAATSADFAFGPWRRYFENADRYSSIRYGPSGWSEGDLFSAWIQARYFVPPCSVMWQTRAIRRIGGWKETLRRNQDGELVMRGLLLGLRFAVSDRGAGIYVAHEGEHRVSKQAQNYPALGEAVDSLHTAPDWQLPAAIVEPALARGYYEVARRAFQSGDRRFGREMLGRSRALGFSGHEGSMPARVIGHIIGLENRIRLSRIVR